MAPSLAERVSEVGRGYIVSPDGLKLTRKISGIEELTAIGRALTAITDSYQWAMGDWINLASQYTLGDKYVFAMEVLGRSYTECISLGTTAEAFPPEMRIPKGLKYSFFRLSVSLDPEMRHEVLMRAYQDRWTTRCLVNHVKELNADKVKPAWTVAGIAARKQKSAKRRKDNSPMVRCPACHHEFPVEGNKVQQGAEE